MAVVRANDLWSSGDAYEPYVGRWSRLVARAFLDWLAEPPDLRWLDVGCGTGVLTQVILEHGLAGHVTGVDQSEDFITYARAKEMHPLVNFRRGAAEKLPAHDGAFDAAVSGLLLNFVDEPVGIVGEMRRAVRGEGTVAAYVWDYGERMQMMRAFWDAAAALDPAARDLDEANRFRMADPGPLAEIFGQAGLEEVETRAIEIDTIFEDFDDYWRPFLGGGAPAPSYCLSLDEDAREALRLRLRDSLATDSGGSIALVARAWAVRGTVPG